MEKVIKDGKVAVLYSPSYGSGWSTSNDTDLINTDALLFDPEIVSLVEKYKKGEIPHSNMCDKIMYHCDNKYGENVVYYGGVCDLTIEWIDVGKEFRITEYDGHESIEYKEYVKWSKA